MVSGDRGEEEDEGGMEEDEEDEEIVAALAAILRRDRARGSSSTAEIAETSDSGPGPARREVDLVLGALLPGLSSARDSAGEDAPDLCTILDAVSIQACRSMEALDGPGDDDERSVAGRERSGAQLNSRLVHLFLESEGRRDDGYRDYGDDLCDPRTVIDAWRVGSIGASLLLLRQCESALRALLETCARAWTTEDGVNGDRDAFECLVSCCQRAPDVATRAKLTLVHWIKTSKSVALWDAYQRLCRDIITGGDLSLHYAADHVDFVLLRRDILSGGEGRGLRGMGKVCEALQRVVREGGEGSGTTTGIAVLMESRPFLQILVTRARAPGLGSEGEEEDDLVRSACTRAFSRLLSWLGGDGATAEAFVSQWSRAFADAGDPSQRRALEESFGGSLLSQSAPSMTSL